MIDIDPVIMCPNDMKCSRRGRGMKSPNMLKVKPIVRCPSSVGCPRRSPRGPRRSPRRSCRRTNCRLVPIGMMGGMGGGMMGGMGGGMMGGIGGGMMGGIGSSQMTSPNSPQMIKPITMGQPMSLMPGGQNCMQFPYGFNPMTSTQGLQGTTIPGNMIYNNGCFQETTYTVLQ